jgi:uncharacterized protein (TIRG00374 family)
MLAVVKRMVMLLVRVGASGGLIFLVFHLGHFGLHQVATTLSLVAGWPLAAAAGCFLVALLAASYKWRELLREQGIQIGVLRVLRLNSIALFYNLVLPGQESGNAVKAMLLGRASHHAEKVWASVVVDQVILFLATSLITLVGLIFNPALPGWPVWMALTLTGLVGALSIHALFLSKRLSNWLDRFLRPISRMLRLPWKRRQAPAPDAMPGTPLPGEWLEPLWNGLRSYQTTWHRLGYVLVLSLVYQLALIAVAYQFGLGLGIHISYLSLTWVMTLVCMAQALPISFAGVGTRDSALIYFLGLLGVAGGLALELSLSMLALNVLMGLPGAVVQFIPDRYVARQEEHVVQGVTRWAGTIPVKVHAHQPPVLPRPVWPTATVRPAVAPQPARRSLE